MTPEANRILGKSGIAVHPIGLGCWAIGGPFWDQNGWMGYGTVDDQESLRALHRALDLGVNFFDTSDVYGCGHSERLLRQAIHGTAHQVIIAAKFGYTFDETTRQVTGQNASPAYIRQACEDSLRRLGRDYIDLYQLHLHSYDIHQALDVRETLESLVMEGKIRWYSWCTEDPDRVRIFARGAHCTASPQLMNVLENNPALLQLCEALNLAPIARRPLGMGLLTGKFHAESTLADNDMRHRFGWNFKTGKQAQALERLSRLREVLTARGHTLAQGCLAWILTKSAGTIPIPGFKTVAQVEENLGTLTRGLLSQDQMNELGQL
jgi:aryl-alcohol dehydrogenase-like predicted oxidoreductase